MLLSAINISEGADVRVIDAIAAVAGGALLDRHSDRHHGRSVLTLASADLIEVALAVTAKTVELCDLSRNTGVHPRLGVVDVVPFTPVTNSPRDQPDLAEALVARNTFAQLTATTLGVPCFYYGPERSLPEIRRRAFVDLFPDVGLRRPHPSAGACCVGAREALVAFNVYLADGTLDQATAIASALRSRDVRALGFTLGDETQVSFNLIAPHRFGPLQAFEAVRASAPVSRCELVGLLPSSVLEAIAPSKWPELDLDPAKTIESRLASREGVTTPR